jgi:hypothetical protein
MRNVLFGLAALVWAAIGFTAGASDLVPTRLQDEPGELRIAVTPLGFDDIGSLLDLMGWAYTEIKLEDLADADLLAQFDVVFVNCSADISSYSDTAAASLEEYVSAGGTLYASDWAYLLIETSFPGYITFYEGAFVGDSQNIQADIVDPGLVSYMSSNTIEIEFYLPSWVPIQSVTDQVRVYLAGDYTINEDPSLEVDHPLTVSFAYGEGRVVYTAFHNEGQPSEEEMKLLEYLVYISATEQLSEALQEQLTVLGYTTREELLGVISTGETSTRYALPNPSMNDLAVSLNWGQGTLRLSVFRPDGSLFAQQEGPPPLVVEIPNAEVGEWSYQVEALSVPTDNYPYVIQVGAPGSLTEQTPRSDQVLLYVGIVLGLCLCGLVTVGLIVGAVILVRRRKDSGGSLPPADSSARASHSR